jgi:hypothetical protein
MSHPEVVLGSAQESDPAAHRQAPQVVELTANDLQELDSATAKITVEGDRYPPDLERMMYR